MIYNFGLTGGANPKELYEALQYSGLVTDDMTYSEMLEALKEAYPEISHIMSESNITVSYSEIKHGSGTTANAHSESATSSKISFMDRCGADYTHYHYATFSKKYALTAGSKVFIKGNIGNQPERDISTGGWTAYDIYAQFSTDGSSWKSVKLYSKNDGFPYSSNGVRANLAINIEKEITEDIELSYVRLYLYARHESYQGYMYLDVTDMGFTHA